MRAREIDILLGTPARLAIVASLTGGGPLSFTQLRQETGLADGNLHVQTHRLLEAGYLEATKKPSGNRTLTVFRITAEGLNRYRGHVRLISQPLGGQIFTLGAAVPRRDRTGTSGGSKDDSQVW